MEAQEVLEVFETYGLTHAEAVPIVDSLRQRPKQWVDFMMRFELGLEEPDPGRAVRSASTIAGAYIAGGLIPLAPYMLMASASAALLVSVVATISALAIFGAVKGHYTGMPLASSAAAHCLHRRTGRGRRVRYRAPGVGEVAVLGRNFRLCGGVETPKYSRASARLLTNLSGGGRVENEAAPARRLTTKPPNSNQDFVAAREFRLQFTAERPGM